jgi:hypothetical protein
MLGNEDRQTAGVGRFPLPGLDEQMALSTKYQLDTLLYCPDAWALRHRFINQDTGEVMRARCNNWTCLHCGPRKVDVWRQLVQAAEPTHFVTLTKVGWTLKEAARVLTTVLQYLRRGSKGYGPDRLGARPAYPIEFLAVLEEHRDFEHVGFHWHMLIKGVDYLPKQVVSDALRSATKGRSYIVHVQAVRKAHAVGYVTKYLTKDITLDKRGVREVQREIVVPHLDEQGNLKQERVMHTVEMESRARRIRYSRHFFPESTADLRLRLFSHLEDSNEIEIDAAASAHVPDQPGDALSLEDETPPVKRSSWSLYEHDPFSQDIADYRERRRQALRESMLDLRAGKHMYSRRVLNVWAYQRRILRQKGW